MQGIREIAALTPAKRAMGAHLLAALASVAAAVLMTWPLARDAGDHILAAIYHWDAYTNAMIMGGRVDAVLGRGPLSLYDNYFFAPLPNTIVYNENLFGLSLIFAPLYLITENPLWAYNQTLLVSLSLSVFFTYLLVRRLTGCGPAGVLAGVAFAFSPYVMFEIGRIQLVATQWIPACFLMLHRAIEERRLRDAVGFWLSYLLQIGTCLYYAMFLVPLLALAGAVLVARQRPPRKLYWQLAATGAGAAVVAFFMVHPYFTAREAFSLERSLSFAASYDGKLGFFTNVHDTNLSLTGLHHLATQRGAHEEIAFPGFTVLALLLLSLGVPFWRNLRDQGLRAAGGVAGRWAGIASLAFTSTVLTHSVLTGAVVFGLCVWHELRTGNPLPFSGRRGLYLALLLLSTVLFLGLEPISFQGEPVRGLYYYLYTYVPGFNGIRKVSRQAVMTTFAFSLLAGFGSAWLFSKLSRSRTRALVLSGLLLSTCYELRCFPHPLRAVWAGATVPEAYRFLATLPPQDRVVTTPVNDGTGIFRGDHGLVLHNYLMLLHKHRSLNGQSSWDPPVTDLVRGALRGLPGESARRILQSVGADHILVHAAELEHSRRSLPQQLAAEPQYFKRVFQQETDSVFSLLTPPDPTLELVESPPLPIGAQLIPNQELHARSSLEPRYAHRAIDGNAWSSWSGRIPQASGQFFELSLARPRSVVAFEIENQWNLTHVPMSFELRVALGKSGWQTVAKEPILRVNRALVYSPKNFVFRVVLPKPTVADRIRLTLEQPVPDRPLTIHEARVYAQQP